MTWYNTALQALGDGGLDLGAGTFKIVFCTSAYTADLTDTGHDFRDDLAGETATVTLGSVTWVDRVMDATTPVTITDPGSGTCTQMVLYKDIGSAATDVLIGHDIAATGLPITFDGTDDSLVISDHLLKLGA